MKMEDIDGCTFLCYQLERGGAGNTLHWQGYLELKNRRSIRALRKSNDFTKRMWFGMRKGTQAQAIEYVTKQDETFVRSLLTEGVKAPGQGKRKDIDAVKERIDAGDSELEIFDNHFGLAVRHHRAFKYYRTMITPDRDWEMNVIVLWGDTGTGKTRYAYDTWPASDIYAVPHSKGSGTYWDGYDGQRVVLIDEMYGNRFKWNFLLGLTDRRAFRVPIHGGFVKFTSRIIVFTSNDHPGEWYQVKFNAWNNKNPFRRRITTIKAFPEGKEWVPSLEARQLLIPQGVTVLAGTSTSALMNLE